MGQEFFINSQELEDKIRQLLPSQGGAGSSFDLSASTQIIPIIDLTESAEGSNLRSDLQTSLSFNSITPFNVENTTTTIINNTGYYRIFGAVSSKASSPISNAKIQITDGTSIKDIIEYSMPTASAGIWQIEDFDFVVFVEAGHSVLVVSNNTSVTVAGSTRQIATIDNVLVNP